MWLLYVTFEDFVCLNHSEKSSHLLKRNINIDNYLKSPNSTPKSNVYKKQADKQVSVSNLKLSTKDNKGKTIVQSEVFVCSQENIGICSDTTCADRCDKQETIPCCREITEGYQIARIQRLGRLRRNKAERFDLKFECNVLNQRYSMDVVRCNQGTSKTDTMHYFNGNNSKTNKRCNKSSNCADVIRVDKSVNFKDNISDLKAQTKDLLSQEGGFKHKQIGSKIGDNYRCKRYNPVLNISSNCLNTPDDRLSASAITNVNGCFMDPRVRTLPDTTSKFKSSNKAPFSLPVRQCWKENRSVENLSAISKSSNDLKRTVLSPLEHGKPEPLRSPKRHCIYMSSKLNYDLLLGENVSHGDTTLSDSFENILTENQESKPQFDDVLLKDVEGEMSRTKNPCDSSPMTISSGYESDSVPTCEAEIDNIFIRNKNKSAGKVAEPTTPTDYFSMSDSLPQNNESQIVADENVPTKINLARVPERNLTKEVAKQNIQNAISSKVQKEVADNGTPARFSPVQRQNYQLTKVARSMFEIIHDLQTEEETNDPNKRKFRKVKRSHSKDMDAEIAQKQSSGTLQVQDNEGNGSDKQTCVETPDNSKADDQSRLSVRCLRKPLGSEPSRFAMGRKNPKNIFTNNSLEQNKRKTVPDQRPSGGDTRMFKQIGELPFESQTQSKGLGVPLREPNLRVPPHDPDVRVPAREPNIRVFSRENESRVSIGGKGNSSSLSNFSHLNIQEQSSQKLRTQVDFRRQHSYEPPRKMNNFESLPQSPRNQTDLNVQRDQNFSKPNENLSRVVLLRGPKIQNGFQDPWAAEAQAANENRNPLQDNWNTVNGNVPLWSCNNRVQIVENGCSPYATSRIPGCQTPRRDERDDHVYETIPGDEFLYEELLRLRMKGILFPRFSKMSDLPGTFIPFEPPALPARNGRRDADNVNRRDHLQRDVNSNFQPTRASFNVPSHSDLVPSDLKLRMRSASWDGYSKIDNYNYISDRGVQPNFGTADFLNTIDDFKQPPPKRRENFYLLLSSKQKRADFSHSLEMETKFKGMGFVLNDKFVNRLNADGYEKMDDLDVKDPSEEIGPQFLQSTYV